MKKFMMILFSILFRIFNVLPINRKKMMFILSHDTELRGNMGAIYEEVLKQGLEYNIVFLSRKEYEIDRSNVSIFELFTRLLNVYLIKSYHLATSRVIILDDFFITAAYLKFKKSVKVIQVWHASCAFKKFGSDGHETELIKRLIKRSSKHLTQVVVNSKSAVPFYASAFNVQEDIVLPLGSPRTDAYFNLGKQDTDELYMEYPELKGKRIILYAPTIRTNNDTLCKNELLKNITLINQALGKEYIFAMRLHPRMYNVLDNLNKSFEYVDVSRFYDVKQLLLAASVLITDYSSIIAEYALLKKPMIFYPYDLPEYLEAGNEFYYKYEEYVPGPIVTNIDAIIRHIKNETVDLSKIEQFLSLCYDYHDGKSSERFVNSLLK